MKRNIDYSINKSGSFRSRTLRIGLSVGAAILLSTLLAACETAKPFKDASGRAVPGSIAFIERVELGGVRQFVSARGLSKENPVLLFLHGGPGSAETPIVLHYNEALQKDFIVVNWDQRGAGNSYSMKIPKESMNIERFVQDAHELVAYLKGRFGKEKIYLVGHSWGSVLGSLLVSRYPEDFIAYAGTGQVVNMTENERISYEFTLGEAKRLKNAKAVKELEKIGAPVEGLYQGGTKSLIIQRKWLSAFHGDVFPKKGMLGLILPAVFSVPEYAGANIFDYLKGSRTSLDLMWLEISRFDLDAAVPEWKVPVYFLIGRHDWNTPWEQSAAYFERLKAPAKTFIWFENSAHSPCMEEPEAFNAALLRMLNETRPAEQALPL